MNKMRGILILINVLFEAMWLSDSECNGVVSTAWACNPEGTPMAVATKKIKKCKKMLKAWNKDRFGSVLQKIKKTKELLWKAEEVSVRTGSIEEVSRLKKELNVLFDREERMWQQRYEDMGSGAVGEDFYAMGSRAD
nr:hypothetical protein CFP56_76325 [Quercus suber]